MAFGKNKYSYTLHHVSLSYCFCGSALLPEFTERRWKEERKKAMIGALAITVVIMASPFVCSVHTGRAAGRGYRPGLEM